MDEPAVIPWTSEKPLYLAPRASPGDILNEEKDRLGYVTTPGRGMRHEPECVGPAVLDSYADLNRRLKLQQHAADVAEAQSRRETISPQHRLDDIARRGRQGHYTDLTRPVHVIQKELDRARLRDQPVNARTMERIVALEELLDGVSAIRLAA